MEKPRINLNQAGNLVHGTRIENLRDITRYGIVTQFHSYDWVKRHSSSLLRHLAQCPCGQDITQEELDRLSNGG